MAGLALHVEIKVASICQRQNEGSAEVGRLHQDIPKRCISVYDGQELPQDSFRMNEVQGGRSMSAAGGKDSGGLDVLTVEEVSMALRCSRAHVYNAIKGTLKGIPPLPSIAVGRRRLVRRQSLIDWLSLTESRVAMIRSSPSI